MNYDYCGACGNKIEFSLHKPNFCPHCGVSTGKASSVSQPPAKKPMAINSIARKPARPMAEKIKDEALAEDETNIDFLPSISSLQYELDGDYSGVGRSAGNLADLLKSGPLGEMGNIAPKKTQRKPSAKKKSRAPRRKKTP